MSLNPSHYLLCAGFSQWSAHEKKDEATKINDFSFLFSFFDTLDGADINECEIDNGNCSNGTCVNTNGSFYCSCHKGFVMSEDDRYKCVRK